MRDQGICVVIILSRLGINRVLLSILLMISCSLTRMRVWSHDFISAVPSRVSLLILHTQPYVAFTYGIPLPPPSRYGFY